MSEKENEKGKEKEKVKEQEYCRICRHCPCEHVDIINENDVGIVMQHENWGSRRQRSIIMMYEYDASSSILVVHGTWNVHRVVDRGCALTN